MARNWQTPEKGDRIPRGGVRWANAKRSHLNLNEKRCSYWEAGAARPHRLHANLIYIDRRKCLLFVNDRTLFNFIVPDVTRPHLRDIPNLFLVWFSCVISAEGFPDEVNKKILSEYEDLRVAQSSSRRVLGSANDLAFHYKYNILEAGVVHSWRIPDIISQMNRMPMSCLRFNYPIEELRRLYGLAVWSIANYSSYGHL